MPRKPDLIPSPTGELIPPYDDEQFWLEEKRRIADSFEYFLNRWVWIEDKVTNRAIKLTLWPAQAKELSKLSLPGPIIIEILKAHQLGYTWIFVAAWELWLSITKTMHQTVINSFREDVGKEIIDRGEFIRVRLPEILYPPLSPPNQQSRQFNHLDERGVPVPSTTQVIAATEKGGQSKTPNVLIFDESCQNRFFEQAYNASLPGIMQAEGKVIIISNAIKTAPGWPMTRALYQGSIAGENDIVRVFLPWWANPNRSRKLVPGMLDGKGQPMTEFKLKTLRTGGRNGGRMTEEDFQQRYPETEEEALSAIGGGFFDMVLGRHNVFKTGMAGHLVYPQIGQEPSNPRERQRQLDPYPTFKQVKTEFEVAKSILRVWRLPYRLEPGYPQNRYWRNRYCIGADVCEGTGRTYTVAYVMDRVQDEFVAMARSNRITATDLAPLLYWLSIWYRNAGAWSPRDRVRFIPALTNVERNGAGQTTIELLVKMRANQYRRPQRTRIPQGDGVSVAWGWQESQQAKWDLSEGLRNWVETMKGTIYDHGLIQECSAWIQQEGTLSLNPEEGALGDRVIAAGLTLQASMTMMAPSEFNVNPAATAIDRMIEEEMEKGGAASDFERAYGEATEGSRLIATPRSRLSESAFGIDFDEQDDSYVLTKQILGG